MRRSAFFGVALLIFYLISDWMAGGLEKGIEEGLKDPSRYLILVFFVLMTLLSLGLLAFVIQGKTFFKKPVIRAKERKERELLMKK